ncbi:MerR family transcriptional regulator [Paenibacillus sp. GXUN7292]|uniref:MerR family transcriptional regulator n=1 Tax=Paenibacillus sp. GXUN7292 TaxID=3422499 RepID=UPI003D7E3B8E
MKISEVAELVGISVRTLHHYDAIGLLSADVTTEAGYRIYSQTNLEQLQQILFFRELGFPLKQIKDIINRPDYDRQEALHMHRKLLLDKRNQLDQLLATVDKTIQEAKGEITMTAKERFAGFDFSSNPYEQEARERYGDKAVDDSKNKINAYTKQGQEELADSMNRLYRELAELRHTDPASSEAQESIAKWYKLLNDIGTYTPEVFRGLGQMYVDDERFTKNIDQFGEGLALFMKEAMAVFADRAQ